MATQGPPGLGLCCTCAARSQPLRASRGAAAAGRTAQYGLATAMGVPIDALAARAQKYEGFVCDGLSVTPAWAAALRTLSAALHMTASWYMRRPFTCPARGASGSGRQVRLRLRMWPGAGRGKQCH